MKKCMGCMRDYGENIAACPLCGYSAAQTRQDLVEMPDVLAPETILGGRFIIGRALSYTDYSVIYISWDALLQRRVAIREYFPAGLVYRKEDGRSLDFPSAGKRELFEKGRQLFEQEAELLSHSQDIDEIVNIYRCVRENNTSYQVMEYLTGYTVLDYLQSAQSGDRQEGQRIFSQVVQAVVRIHRRGIGHYNLTPDNIYLEEKGGIRLTDFGAAKLGLYNMVNDRLDIYYEPYMAPEALAGEPASLSADIYSLGVLYYSLMTGNEPKDGLSRRRRRPDLRLPDKEDERIVKWAAAVSVEDRLGSVEKLQAMLAKSGM